MLKAFEEETSSILKVDAGGFFREFVDPNLRLQTYYLLEAIHAMKYDVINVGYPDFRHGLDTLQKLQKEMDLPFISANIVDAKTKKPYFPTHLILTETLKNGKKIKVGIIGVTAPNGTASNPADQVLPPKPPPMEGVYEPEEHDGEMLAGAAAPELPQLDPGSSSRWAITPDLNELLLHAAQGGGPALTSTSGGHSPALEFALDTTTPTLSHGAYEVLDEVAAVEPIAQKLRTECEVLVLLAYDGPGRTRRIAETVPYFDVVVAGDSYQRFDPFYVGENNNTLWVSSEHEGRFLGKVEFSFDADGMIASKVGDLMPVDQNIFTIPSLTKFIDAYKRDTAYLPPPPGQKLAQKIFTGANRCQTCHVQEFAQWQTHKHSHAMKTLVDRKMEYNPDCLRCHTVSFGQPGGFTDLRVTPYLSNVQCESCHGAGVKHVAEERKIAALPADKRESAKRTAHMNMTFDAKFCMQCHNPENDPDFNFAEDIKHVRHDSTQPNRVRNTTGTMSAKM
jgi:hypothetical protein